MSPLTVTCILIIATFAHGDATNYATDCKYSGQFLLNAEDECSYMVCEFSLHAAWSSGSLDEVKYQVIKLRCPSGLATNLAKFSVHNPCSEPSPNCTVPPSSSESESGEDSSKSSGSSEGYQTEAYKPGNYGLHGVEDYKPANYGLHGVEDYKPAENSRGSYGYHQYSPDEIRRQVYETPDYKPQQYEPAESYSVPENKQPNYIPEYKAPENRRQGYQQYQQYTGPSFEPREYNQEYEPQQYGRFLRKENKLPGYNPQGYQPPQQSEDRVREEKSRGYDYGQYTVPAYQAPGYQAQDYKPQVPEQRQAHVYNPPSYKPETFEHDVYNTQRAVYKQPDHQPQGYKLREARPRGYRGDAKLAEYKLPTYDVNAQGNKPGLNQRDNYPPTSKTPAAPSYTTSAYVTPSLPSFTPPSAYNFPSPVEGYEAVKVYEGPNYGLAPNFKELIYGAENKE